MDNQPGYDEYPGATDDAYAARNEAYEQHQAATANPNWHQGQMQPETYQAAPQPTKLHPRWHQLIVGLTELMKLLDWFIMLLKVLDCGEAGEEYYDWVVFVLVMASWITLQKAFDQVALLLIAGGWAAQQLTCIMAIFFPLDLWFLPTGFLTFCLYRKEYPNSVVDERAIFAQRPLSTVLLGLPFSGVMGMLVDDEEFVLHPVQIHIRAMQAIYHATFEIIPNFIIDLVVIVNAAERGLSGTHWFLVSFVFSVFEIVILCFISVKHINEAEQRKPLPHKLAVKRTMF